MSETILFTTASRLALGPNQPPNQLTPEPGCPGHETDHALPSSAEVKNAWSYAFTPPYAFMTWCLVKHRDNFTSTLFTCFSIHHPTHLSNFIIDNEIIYKYCVVLWLYPYIYELTFLVLAEWAYPVATNTLDLTQPLFPQGADLPRELHLCDFCAVVGPVLVLNTSGQNGSVERQLRWRASRPGPVRWKTNRTCARFEVLTTINIQNLIF
jgi:hypothetical protein